MDLMKNMRKQDIKTLASEPLMYYGKAALLTMGAFLVGRLTKKML